MDEFYINIHNEQVARMIAGYISQIPNVSLGQIKAVAEEARIELSQPAPKPTYPIWWDSDKQRKAYFASKGFGRGIPYVRNGGYENAWSTFQHSDTGVTLFNKAPGARYVGGSSQGVGQSNIHAGRWPLAINIVIQKVKNLKSQVEYALRQMIAKG